MQGHMIPATGSSLGAYLPGRCPAKGQVVGCASADAEICIGRAQTGQLRGIVCLRQEVVVQNALELVAQVQSVHDCQICTGPLMYQHDRTTYCPESGSV